jgi:threonyl-tRNA synthetase
MPLWLAPVQVVVLNISEGQADYAERVAADLRRAGWRCNADLRSEKINYKIREHSLEKLPYQLIVGEKEKAAEKVAVRTRSGEDLGQMNLSEFIVRLQREAHAGGTA